MVYVSRFTAHKQISIHVPIGHRLPMYCTSSGRAYLAALPDEAVKTLLGQSELVSLTPKTITDPGRILKLIKTIRLQGFASIVEEMYIGEVSVSACILNADGLPLGSVNISVPLSRWKAEEAIAQLAPKAIETARAISRAAAGLRPQNSSDRKLSISSNEVDPMPRATGSGLLVRS